MKTSFLRRQSWLSSVMFVVWTLQSVLVVPQVHAAGPPCGNAAVGGPAAPPDGGAPNDKPKNPNNPAKNANNGPKNAKVPAKLPANNQKKFTNGNNNRKNWSPSAHELPGRGGSSGGSNNGPSAGGGGGMINAGDYLSQLLKGQDNGAGFGAWGANGAFGPASSPGGGQPRPSSSAGWHPPMSRPTGSSCPEGEELVQEEGECSPNVTCKKIATAGDTLEADFGVDMSAYTGNAQVDTNDTSMQAGDALSFDRTASTRTNSQNISRGVFGREAVWTHNYQWFMRDAGALNGQPRISIAFPTGGDYTFTRNSTFPQVWDAPAGTGMSLNNNSNDFVLELSDASTYNFKRIVNATTGAVSYRIESYEEDAGSPVVFTYNNATDTLIRKVTDSTGRFLQFIYQNVGSFQVQRVALGEIAYQSPAGQWIEVPVTNTGSYRYLAAYYTNDYRDAPPVPVGEMEFYDENNVKITGTAFASDPLAQDDPQNPTDAHGGPKAFDGDTATYYQYAYQRNGYVGIDAGAGKKVSKVRIFVTGNVTGVNVVGRLQFFGMNETGSANWVVKEVKTSDNLSTIYDYEVFNDPSGFFRWVNLTAVHYDDGTVAHYTYQQTHDFSPPQLIEVQDPRQDGTLPMVRFDYYLDAPLGFVERAVNALSGETIASTASAGEHSPQMVFADGRTTRMDYTNGRPTKLTDGLGKATTFTYDANGFVASMTDALLRVTTWTNDSRGRQLTATHPNGLVETWTRDADGRPLTYTLSGPAVTSRTTTYTRDAAGRVPRVDYPDGTFESWAFNAQGQPLTHTAVNGGIHTWTYNARGLVETEVNALGGTTTFTYDGRDRMLTMTDPAGGVTTYSYNSLGAVHRVTAANGDFTEFGYDDFKNLISETDQAGNTKSYEYNTFSLLTKVTDALGRSTLLEYGSASGGGGCSCNIGGKPTTVTYADGTVVRNVYDKEWRLISATAGFGTPLARTVTYTYDAVGNKTKQTNPDTTFTAWTYDNMDRVATIKDKANATVTLTYDLFDNVLTRTSVTGGDTAYEYDLMNRPVKTTDALGKITETTYHADGKVKTVKDPLNRVTEFTYDLLGRRKKTILPGGTLFTETFYRADGLVIEQRDVQGHSSFTTYDNVKRVASRTDATGRTTTYSYLPFNTGLRHEIVKTPAGRQSARSYDAVGRLRFSALATTLNAAFNSSWLTTEYQYDAADRVIKTIQPDASFTLASFDLLGRRQTSTDELGRTTAYEYDVADRLTRTTYPDGQFATKTYDSTVGRLTSETDTGGRTIAYQYFADGKLRNYRDARLRWYNFEYDALRRLSKRVFPDNTFWQYTYDDAGQMATMRKANGVIATYSYDTLGRQTLTDWSDATPDTASTYDDEGRLLSATHGASVTTRSYDDEGRLLSETQTLSGNALTYAYTYDTDGLPASMTRPDGSVVEYGYDARGWMAELTVDGPPPVVSYSHDARGRVTGHSFETGLQVLRDLDAAGQLESITNSLGTTVLSSFTYGYDLAGQRTHVLRADGKGDRYAYDAARQVVGADLDAPNPAANGTGAAASRSYAYDLGGNRTTAAEADLIANTSSSTAYTTNAVNAYTNVGGTAFTYDLDGNMTRGLARNDGSLNGPLVPMNFTWDAHNRLKTAAPVTAAAGRLRGTYTYDAQGRRILRVVEVYQGGTWVLQNTVRYSHDGWNMNYEVSVDAASQTAARRLTWGKDLSGSVQGAGGVGGLLMSETSTDGGTTWAPAYHLYDGNGNGSTVVDGTGAVLAAYSYDPYGRVVASNGTQAATNVWRFSTKPVDAETGWSYYGYRYYSAELGRWTARDPIAEAGGVNLYQFVLNNPLALHDPNGHSPAWGIPPQVANDPEFAESYYDTAQYGALALLAPLGAMCIAAPEAAAVAPFIAVVLKNGTVVKGPLSMSHKELIKRKFGGELPECARAVTCGTHNGKLEAVNSMSLHGNQMPVAPEVLKALQESLK